MKDNQITEGPIFKQLCMFFFPILVGYFFQQLYNTVDSIIVGRYVGSYALAAVGGTGTLINLLVGFFIGLSSGASVIISQFYGAKNKERLKDALHTGIALSITGGLVLTILGLIFSKMALEIIHIPSDIMDASLTYIRIFFLGMIPSMIYNVGAGMLRAVGDSKRPRDFLIITCILNIILDFIFVLFLKLDVAGVAIATVLSQVISAILVLNTFLKTDDIYKINLNQVKFDSSCLKEITRIGLPAGGQSVLYSLSNLIIQSGVNQFGTSSIAAWTTFGKIDAIIWMVLGALGTSVLTFVGQNYGANKPDRVKQSIRVSLITGTILIGGISLVLFIFTKPLVMLFTTDTQVIVIGTKILKLLMPFYVAFIFNEVLSSTIKGTGEGLGPMLITVFSICLVRFIWMLGIVPIYHSIYVASLVYPVTWILSSVAFIIYYLYYRKKIFKE